MSLYGEKSLPSLPIDKDTSRSLTPVMDGAEVTTPKSAIIALPPDWSTENSPGNSTNISRSSFEGHPPASFPLSASSSSSSSNPIFSWPTSSFDASSSRSGPSHRPMRERTDPFDRSSPFDFDERRKSGSSSEEELLNGGLPAFLAESADIAHGVITSGSGAGSAEDVRRGSVVMIPHQMRALTDPDLVHGLPVDSEITGAVPHDGFDFTSVGNGDAGAGSQGLAPPAFNRTFSAPLPNRVGSLRHPLSPSEDPLGSHSAHPPRQAPTSTSFSALGGPSARTLTSNTPATPPTPGISRSDSSPASSEKLETPIQTLSMELADSLQSAIQTLLHLSPPHLLDNAKEQYSGCTVQMPSTSLSALLTSMRSLNYFSANIQNIVNADNKQASSNPADSGLLAAAANRKREDFDIGELLQNVADLMSGQASQAGVDLVLFHGDVGIKHVSVNGDVEGLGYLLGHILRQILLVADRRDTIELGLQVIPQSPSMTPRVSLPLSAADIDRSRRRESSGSTLRSSSPGRTLPTPPSGSAEGPVLCTFEIIHNLFQPLDPTTTPKAEMNPFTHLDEEHRFVMPKFDTIVCRRLLQHQNASLRVDTQPSSPLGNGLTRRAYELTVLLPRGNPLVEPTPLTNEEEAVRQPFTHVKLAREPTLEELSQFADSLRGKKVVLHASLSSLFARHLTSYLGAWGMDISHLPVEEEEAVTERPSVARSSTAIDTDVTTAMASMSIDTAGENSATASRFIIIDDDVDVLKRELLKIRTDMSLTLKPRLSKRPTLLSRARSSPLVRQTPIQPPPSNLVLIHFTSLANYNHVRDVVATHLGTAPYYGSGAFGYPEVMVIPKPVGPRRFLTALHTAVNQPVIDPSFSPIATSPRSPGGGHFLGSVRTPSESGREGFFDTIPEGGSDGEGGPLRVPSDGGSQKARSPLGEYPPTTAASYVRTDRGLHIALPTPGEIMSTPAAEYFSNAGMRTGSAGGSAVVMQSPDGRPFGMFFEPPVKSERRTVSGSRPNNGARKIPNRKTSIVPDKEIPETGSGSQGPSPAGSRRHSTLSNNADHSGGSSRRGSTKEMRIVSGGSAEDAPQLTRKMTRKESLPVSSSVEPILAQGRARSGTVTREVTIKRRQPGVPGGVSPSTENVPKAPARATKKKEEDMVVPPINVLIVEDNPINQNILSMFLKKKKIKHQTAKDGLEAVEKWKTGGFHLILMDIQLPVMDGIEATTEIRRQEQSNNIGVFPQTPASESSRTLAVTPSGEIPSTPLKSMVIIVALTASSLHSDRVRALAAGCNDFLTKPVSLKWLERKIIEWGCMQALIDFEGWRRWKSSDPKDPAGETKRAFSTAPQAAAKSLAGRLKINPDRKSLRQSSVSSTAGSATLPNEPSPAKSTFKATSSSPLSARFSQHTPSTGQPEITVQAATPDPHDQPVQPDLVPAAAAEELEKARSDLNDSTNVIVRDPDEAYSNPTTKPGETIEGDSAIGMGVGPPPDLTSRGSGGASVEPDLNSIEEGLGGGGEKPLPEIPNE